MLRSRSTRRWRIWVIAWALMVCPVTWAGAVEVITSSDHAGMAIDRPMIRAMFSARLRQWPDGTPVKVFVLNDDDPVHVQFCRDQLGTFPYVLRASWDRLVYTGTGIPPETVGNEREMRARVAATRGAIGYVSTRAASSGTAPLPLTALMVLGD